MGECPGAGMTEKLQRIKADPGTKITFNWDQSPDSLPTVIHMSSCSGSWDDFDCNFSGGKDLGKTTVGERNSISFTVPEDTKPGSFFCFADSYGDHCKKGIHSTVKIGSEKHGDDGQMASRGNSESEKAQENKLQEDERCGLLCEDELHLQQEKKYLRGQNLLAEIDSNSPRSCFSCGRFT